MGFFVWLGQNVIALNIEAIKYYIYGEGAMDVKNHLSYGFL